MNAEQLLSDGQGIDTSSLMPDLTSQLTDLLAPVLMASAAVTIVFLALFISSTLRRRKVERAILDIQKTLHEMNERDKARLKPAAPPVPPQNDSDKLIAAKPSEPDTLS